MQVVRFWYAVWGKERHSHTQSVYTRVWRVSKQSFLCTHSGKSGDFDDVKDVIFVNNTTSLNDMMFVK
jgi:hypothetical protein